MNWRLDNPLYSLSTDEQNEKAKKLWEGESLGGIKADNNRLPVPIVGLIVLTIFTAFAITFPLFGQRPTAAIYERYVDEMNSPDVRMIVSDVEKMAFIVEKVKAEGSEHQFQLDQHPIDMDDLRLIAPQIIQLRSMRADLRDYTVVGSRVILASFEGNMRDDGTQERFQPWWDIGYTIDIFFILIFYISVTVAIKRLPPYTYKPDHSKNQ